MSTPDHNKVLTEGAAEIAASVVTHAVNEFGYFPESTKSQLTDIWNKANKTPH